MVKDIIIPSIDIELSSKTSLVWHSNDGDHVEKDEVIASIHLDKCDMELHAPMTGILCILKPYGSGLQDGGHVIATVTDEPPKYITTDIDGVWWSSREMPKIIERMEKENPGYEFLQVVTSPGNGGYSEYAIMKLIK